jgi:hypothetical protein
MVRWDWLKAYPQQVSYVMGVQEFKAFVFAFEILWVEEI